MPPATVRANAPAPEPGNSITFPMTLDYWASWSMVRGISEAVANAFDETDDADHIRFEWANGWLEIEDAGPGMPRQGLLLGFSSKRNNSKVIGQFGEGLCAALLLAARNNTKMYLETVGYSVTPEAYEDPNLNAKVLRINFGPSQRTRGTLVRFKVTEKTALAVRERFIRFTPGYQPPTNYGRVVEGVKGGNLFIGGVIIRTGTDHHFSYDLSLEKNKRLQNRDRTTVDEIAVGQSISQIISELRDPEIFADLIRAAEADRCDPAELRFEDHNPALKRILIQTRTLLFGDSLVAVTSHQHGQDASAAYLGYQILATKGKNAYALSRIYADMGIPYAHTIAAGTVSKQENERRERVEKIVNVPLKDLTPLQTDNLTRGIETFERAFGHGCLGAVKVFSGGSHPRCGEEDYAIGGYYQSAGKGTIFLLQTVLDTFEGTLKTMFHELGHRRAHREPGYVSGYARGDYGDLSAGFEKALVAMGNQMLVLALDHQALPLHAAAKLERPNKIAGQVVTAQLRNFGLSQKAAAEQAFVSQSMISNVKQGGMVSYLKPLFALAELLQLDGDLLCVLLASSRLHNTGRRKDGRARGGIGISKSLVSVEALIGRYGDLAVPLAIIQGYYLFPFTDLTEQEYYAPFYQLLAVFQAQAAEPRI